MSSQSFVVRAIDSNLQIVELEVEALDDNELTKQVLALNLTLLSHKPARRIWSEVIGWNKKNFDLLLFVQEIDALSSAGLNLTEALETLLERNQENANQLVLLRVLEDLKRGLRLSQALEQQPRVFPPLLIGIIQSSEDTSDLPRALKRYLQYEMQLRSLRQKITSAAIYPAILLIVGAAVALFLLGYVVPRFAGVYQGKLSSLPVASKWLLIAGQWISDHAALTFAGSLALAAVIGWWVLELQRTNQWWRILKALPGAAPRLEILELSRLYLTLGMLLEGGLPIDRSMHLASSVLSKENQIPWQKTRTMIAEGLPLTTAMEQNNFCTSVATRLLRVGERSGQIDTMLGKAAAFYDAETSRWIDTFSKTFEPVLMAAIGILIGAIVILLYIPVFDLAGSIQ